MIEEQIGSMKGGNPTLTGISNINNMPLLHCLAYKLNSTVGFTFPHQHKISSIGLLDQATTIHHVIAHNNTNQIVFWIVFLRNK